MVNIATQHVIFERFLTRRIEAAHWCERISWFQAQAVVIQNRSEIRSVLYSFAVMPCIHPYVLNLEVDLDSYVLFSYCKTHLHC